MYNLFICMNLSLSLSLPPSLSPLARSLPLSLSLSLALSLSKQKQNKKQKERENYVLRLSNKSFIKRLRPYFIKVKIILSLKFKINLIFDKRIHET